MRRYFYREIAAQHYLEQLGFKRDALGYHRNLFTATIFRDGNWFVAEWPVGF